MKILINNQQNCIRLNRTEVRKAAGRILSLLGLSKAELSILFVDDSGMQQLNNTFRGIDRTTDVLAFDAQIPVKAEKHYHGCAGQETVLGDVVINTRRAFLQAGKPGIDFYDEVYRLLIHGVLHLIGYDHKKKHEALNMRKKEREILDAF